MFSILLDILQVLSSKGISLMLEADFTPAPNCTALDINSRLKMRPFITSGVKPYNLKSAMPTTSIATLKGRE